MRKVIGTIGATLAIVVVATSAAPAGAHDTAADRYSSPGPHSRSADLGLAQRANDDVRRVIRNDDLAAVVSDAPAGLRAKRRDASAPTARG
jgi:hypothetical protein